MNSERGLKWHIYTRCRAGIFLSCFLINCSRGKSSYVLVLYETLPLSAQTGEEWTQKGIGGEKGLWTVFYFCLWRIDVDDRNLPQPSIFSVCRSTFHSEFLSLGWILSICKCRNLPGTEYPHLAPGTNTKIFSLHCKASEVLLRWNFAGLGNEGFICTFWASLS